MTGIVIAGGVVTGIVIVLFVGLVQWVWNVVPAEAFGAPHLSYWQTFGCMFILGVVGSAFRATTK